MVDKNNTNSEDKMNEMNLDLNSDSLCEGSLYQIIILNQMIINLQSHPQEKKNQKKKYKKIILII